MSSRTVQVRDDFFMLCIKKSSLTRSVAPPLKLAIASLDCKFIFDKAISHLFRRSSFPKCKQFLGLHFGFLFSRYNSRYGIPKDWFLPFVVATIVATQRPVPIPAAFWQDPRTRP